MERYSLTDHDGQRLEPPAPIHDSCPACGYTTMDRQAPDQDQESGILMRLRFSDIPLVLLIAGQIWMASTGIEIDPNYRFYGALITIIYAGAWVIWRMSDR